MKTIPIRDGALIQLKQAVNRVVPFDAKVLDVGAGLCGKYQKSVALRASRYVMVDAHSRYLNENEVAAEKIVGVAPGALKQFETGSFDVALAIDFIEHLSVDDAYATLKELARVAHTTALFTPEGWYDQHGCDVYHMGGEYWQTHRSGWTAEELEALGFDVEIWGGFHLDYVPIGAVTRGNNKIPPGASPNALWAVRSSV
jgi:hypothetical protein